MDKPHLKLILFIFTYDMKAGLSGLLEKDRCPCMSHAWYHEDTNPTYMQEDAIVLSTTRVV
jgi:hypothetical protein